jgi:hypothetical protein
MQTRKTSELTRCVTDERKLADAATNFTIRMHHRRIEEGCAAELRARKAPGYTEPVPPENPRVLGTPRP